MNMWLAILTVCVTLWILQRLIRTRGKGSALLNEGKLKKKVQEASDPPSGGAECKSHQYDVFINHRGPDVKKTFVAHLNAALERDGFRPFLDAKGIGQGHHVFKSIDEALKGACVHVAIFSKRYAESKYCLNELCDMLKSEHVILPIFYDVNPEDLRRVENGPFKKGFRKHIKRGRREEVEKWKEALCKVADFRGFRLDEVNGDEWQLISRILEEVRKAMPPTLLPGKERYGIEGCKKDVLKTLETVSVVGLVGVGGIGKTTLAEEIYNHFVGRKQFKRYCFLRDVRSSEQSQLQQKLMQDLGHECGVKDLSPEDYNRVFDGLMCQKVLVVVDDIDHSSQFKALFPGVQKLGCGSQVVITSRQRDVLNHAMSAAPSQAVYEVPVLNKCDSRRLFNSHALLGESPSEWCAELAVKVADACGGHALSLEIIGASLSDKKNPEDMGLWLEAVKALQGNDDIFGKLQSTYKSLPSDGDKMMFRDIACMLIGMEKDVALTIWKSCNSPQHHCSTSDTPALTSLRRLMDRSLVKLDEEGRLRMHDVLRDMGRDIVKKDGGGAEHWTHLWDAAAATKVLGRRKRNNRTRGMSLDGAGSCDASDLAGMKELHLLVLDGCHVVVPDDFSSWPQELRWLQWRLFCFASLPSHLKLPNLVVLDLSNSDKLTRLWENDADVQLPLLQMLNLTWCNALKELPENVGESFPKLKRLVMDVCSRLRSLPDSIGHLTGLEHLHLSQCRALVSLPDAIVRLVSLRTLILRGCWKLQQLPEELGNLTNLETLNVLGCHTLSELPAWIGGLRMLKELDLSISSVEGLPAGFSLLTSLTSLSLRRLHSTPETFQGLQALSSLRLSEGSGDLGDLGTLAALKQIQLLRHATITILPKSLENLKWLVDLTMYECPELLIVEALPEGLRVLRLVSCSKLTEIPSLAAMRCLWYLDLKDCGSLRHVYGIECVTTLKKIDVSGCGSLRHMYGLECVTTLKEIDVSGCTSIEGCRIDGTVNSALCKCDVSGSKVGVAYNNRWLEREPAEQVIRWLGNAITPLSNGMANPVALLFEKDYFKWTLVLEATIKSEAECLALICWLVINHCEMKSNDYYYDWKVEVWRDGQLVVECKSPLYGQVLGNRNVVNLWTWRREHHVLQSLQVGDRICVYLQPYKNNCTMVEGGVCVVHYYEDEKLVLAMNSEELNMSRSEALAEQFGQLVLEDQCEELISCMN